MNTLASKIATVTIEVGGKLNADKKNKEQNYEYLSSDKIISVCGQALANKGIVIIPEVSSQEVKLDEYTDKYDKAKRRYDAQVEFVFCVTDGETELMQKWQGLGCDYSSPDKALYKAITSGHKYFLMKLVGVGIGNEDSEHENEPQSRTNGHKAVEGITLEEALEMTDRNGVKYCDTPTEKLAIMANAINSSKKELTAEQLRKATGLSIVLAARKDGTIAEPSLVATAAELGGVQA